CDVVGTEAARDVTGRVDVDVQQRDGARAGRVELAEIDRLDAAADPGAEADAQVDRIVDDVPLALGPANPVQQGEGRRDGIAGGRVRRLASGARETRQR